MLCKLLTIIIYLHSLVLFCESNNHSCPTKCACLQHIVDCEDIDLTNQDLTKLVRSIPNTRTETIYLGKNNLTDFSLSIFKDLRNIKELDLNDNKLTKIPENLSGALRNLNYLNMNGNKVRKLDKNSFIGYGGLHTLHLTNNGIETLEKDSLFYLVHIRDLYLDKNKLKSLPKHAFAKNHDLLSLSITSNRLQYIAPNVFDHLSRLDELYLDDNTLASFPNYLFSSNKYLTHIDLSNNHLQSLPKYGFSNMTNIGILNLVLANNRLPTLKTTSFENSKELYVSLHGNPLNCDCNLLSKMMKITRYRKNIIEDGTCASPDKVNGQSITRLNHTHIGCGLCDVSGCENTATCVSEKDGKKERFECQCKASYTGKYCEVVLNSEDSCHNNTCTKTEVCLPVSQKNYKCRCADPALSTPGCLPRKQSVVTWAAVGVSIVVAAVFIAGFVIVSRKMKRRKEKSRNEYLVENAVDNELL